jgi:SAM-dependent methyltransferase
MKAVCQVCGSNEWLNLPDPAEGRAVTTAGRIVNEPLGKAQCAECGFVQRVHARFLGDTDYYEQDYAKYYDRPGTTQFHTTRYRVLTEWMASVLNPWTPSRILDVGCGQGWAMELMKALYPEADIEGLEPSHYNTRVARDKGFVVYETRAGEAASMQNKYDLVYSNNVIQHVTNAREFVSSLKEMVSEEGVIVITCPDGSVPNIEILWGDQNFSFLPAHLIRLCEDTGFEAINWFSSPPSPSVPPAQMLVLSPGRKLQECRSGMNIPTSSLEEIYHAKCEYLKAFEQIDGFIYSRTEDYARVFNLGASYWSSILAAYCPRYWQRVSACLVDNADDVERSFLDKGVLALSSITTTDGDALVFGTSPSTHKALCAKFSNSWKKIVPWDDFAVQY